MTLDFLDDKNKAFVVGHLSAWIGLCNVCKESGALRLLPDDLQAHLSTLEVEIKSVVDKWLKPPSCQE